MAESSGYSLIDHIKSKALKFWARFSDDEESEVVHARDELENEQGVEADEETIHRQWDEDSRKLESAGPTERPDFESPGSYPPSHRHQVEEGGPQGVKAKKN